MKGSRSSFRKEGIRFAPSDLGTWGQFFAARFGRMGGMFHVPEWLAGVFGALAKDVSPKSICDPWAGIGFLLESLREACQPTEALAFTQIQGEHELGKVLVPGEVQLEHWRANAFARCGVPGVRPCGQYPTDGWSVCKPAERCNRGRRERRIEGRPWQSRYGRSLTPSESVRRWLVCGDSVLLLRTTISFPAVRRSGLGSSRGAHVAIRDVCSLHTIFPHSCWSLAKNRQRGCSLHNYQVMRKRTFKFSIISTSARGRHARTGSIR